MSLFGSFWKKGSNNSRPSRWQVGDKIANRFEIHQISGGEGKSGMGIVYICYDHRDKTPYALKTFQKQYLFSEESQRLFEREALVWTCLERYPYIVRAEWVERLEGRLFIVLEYIAPNSQGRNTLTHYLGNLSLPEILKIAIQFCYGMEYAYSRGIDAHRDIKPDNIMITSNKIVKITDFGLTKAFQELRFKEEIMSLGKERPGLSIFQTKAGKRACGTLRYMAPEQFDGYADERSDIYSFGITLYEMVTGGQLPFIGKGRTQHEVQQDYERLHKYEKAPSISSPLSSVIQRCLEKDPEIRYQDFTILKEELQDLLLEETGETLTPPEITELEAWELSNKGVALENLGKCQESLTCYDKALEIDPRNTRAWYNKGVALGKFGRCQESLTCYHRALEINPRYADAWNNKGVALHNLGRYQESLTCYDRALEINPRYAEVWNNKGVVLSPLGRYHEALRCAEEAIKLRLDFAQAHQLKQLILKKLRR